MSDNENNVDREGNSEEEKDKKKKAKKKVKIDLFPPLKTKPEAPKVNILVDNKFNFPKVGIIGDDEFTSFVGHALPVLKIIYISNQVYNNHLCSTIGDGVIKLWKINGEETKCEKNINVKFETADILTANENYIAVCGYKLILLDLKTEESITIFSPFYSKYTEFNLLTRINETIGAASSLNGYILFFDLSNGNSLKKIEMNKEHFICEMERNQKLLKEEKKRKKLEKEAKLKEQGIYKKEDSENEESEEEEEKSKEKDNAKGGEGDKKFEEKKENKSEKKSKKKIARDLGSAKCSNLIKGHKRNIYSMIGLNSSIFQNCVITGGEDNCVKLFKIDNDGDITDFIGHENTVISLAVSDTQEHLFSGSFDYTIRKWDLSSGECLSVMEFIYGIPSVLLPLTNDHLISFGLDSRFMIWNEEALNIKTFVYKLGVVKTALLLPAKDETENNTFIFGDTKGNIGVKQIIIGDDNINTFNEKKNGKKEEGNRFNNMYTADKTAAGNNFKEIMEEIDNNNNQ